MDKKIITILRTEHLHIGTYENTVKPQKIQTMIFRNTLLFEIYLGRAGFREYGLFISYFNHCQ